MRALSLLLISLSIFIHSTSAKERFEFTFEELANMTYSSATLTETHIKDAPASTTLITAEMIRHSGARSLEELLERYVPGLQKLDHTFSTVEVGIRGILTEDNEKILVLVNGRVMNLRSFYGFDSEKMQSMLRDIAHIEVVRGPGSATFGPGAIAGVGSITTYNGLTFEGTEINATQGAFEQFTTFELKHSYRFDDQHALFFYFGVDDYLGADQKYSKIHTSHISAGGSNDPALQAARIISFNNSNIRDHHQAARDKPRYKIHLQYSGEDLEVWLRFLRGGVRVVDSFGVKEGRPDLDRGHAYDQLTFNFDKGFEINEFLKAKLSLSYVIYQRLRLHGNSGTSSGLQQSLSIREDKYLSKLLFNLDLDDHQVAFGTEFSYAEHGKDPYNISETGLTLPGGDKWYTDMYSFFAEHQWAINDKWRLFSGARLDKHKYSQFLFSPRLAAVWTPTSEDTVKAMLTRSYRKKSDYYARNDFLKLNKEVDSERLDSIELIYNKEFTNSLEATFTAVYSDWQILIFGADSQENEFIGDMKLANFEFELKYYLDNYTFSMSHTYTKMLEFELKKDSVFNILSAHPYGYGKNLANWSDHLSKFQMSYDWNKNLSTSLSAVVYW
ncbi:MAG: TonB-dependent receptor, partial [Lentisphaeraceae bacterium]|nr:TonB-dependent receptor [Lentisphaeraceae bacterium]